MAIHCISKSLIPLLRWQPGLMHSWTFVLDALSWRVISWHFCSFSFRHRIWELCSPRRRLLLKTLIYRRSIFAILFTFSFDTIALTPELVGSGFLLLALNSLFKQLEFREQGNESIFNLGLYIGIASLFALSFAIFIVACSLILIFFTRSSAKAVFPYDLRFFAFACLATKRLLSNGWLKGNMAIFLPAQPDISF